MTETEGKNVYLHAREGIFYLVDDQVQLRLLLKLRAMSLGSC